MKILVLTNHSQKIASIAQLTIPNKREYCERHGYDFSSEECDFGDPQNHVRWLEKLQQRVKDYDVVMTIGCDALFMNHAVGIESKACWSNSPQSVDKRVAIAREHLSWFPINNDVMIWPKGYESNGVIAMLIESAPTWLHYPWFWQAHLWDLMQINPTFNRAIRLVEAREMNSTWRDGPSKWRLGDWILHAVDCDLNKKAAVIKAYLPFVGNGLYSELPKEITGRK